MSSKMGRPTNDPKKNETRIRMSDTDLDILNYCCQQTGMTKADVIRVGIRKVYEEIRKKE